MRRIASAAALLLACGAGAAPAAVPAELAIVHATLYPGSGPALTDATLVIGGGRILSVAAAGAVPAGIQVVDARGRYVTAPLFHPATRLGLADVADGVDAGSRTGEACAYRPERAFDRNAPSVTQARADGVLHALLVPAVSATGICAGHSGILRLGPEPRFLPGGGALLLVHVAEDAAAGYSHEAGWRQLEELAGLPAEGALSPAVRGAKGPFGSRPLGIVANREADIRQVLEFAARVPNRVILFGGAEAWRVADQLARQDIPVVLDPLEALPADFDRLGARHDNARLLAAAGVRIAFSASAQGIYTTWNAGPGIREAAGIAVSHGLSAELAIAAITRTPAEILGLAADIGRLAPGAAADFVLWDGDPLEPSTNVAAMYVDGIPISLQTRQSRLAERYGLQEAGE